MLATFAQRAPTRYEQLAVLREHYGFSELSHPARADLLAFARGVAIASTKDKFVVAALADEMRRRRIVIPGITVIERMAGQACTEAEEALFADVAARLSPAIIFRMEALLGIGPRLRQSGISWLREPPGRAGDAAIRELIDRLEAVRHVGLASDVLQAVPAVGGEQFCHGRGLSSRRRFHRAVRVQRAGPSFTICVSLADKKIASSE